MTKESVAKRGQYFQPKNVHNAGGVLTMNDRGMLLDADWADFREVGKRGSRQAVIGGKRGKCKGWSPASRRRLREVLLNYRPESGYRQVDMTFTIPGDLPSREDWQALFGRFKKSVERLAACMVWRLELQERGAPHLHCLVGVPPSYRLKLGREIVHGSDVAAEVGRLWKRALGDRMAVRGADRHAVDYHEEGGGGHWLRYLCDHASKAKQAQVAVGWGRHWGVIGKGHMVKLPGESISLTPQQWPRLVRTLRRLCRRSIPADCAFGFKLGYAPRRGYWGRSVWFVAPTTLKRIVEDIRADH